MNLKIIKGTLAGGILSFLLGWLVYGILLMDFYAQNMNNCANRPEEEMVMWGMLLSNLLYGLSLTLICNWAGAKTIMDGIRITAIIGFLYALGMDLSFYSMTTMLGNFSVLLVDVLVYTLLSGLMGLVIVLSWGKPKTA